MRKRSRLLLVLVVSMGWIANAAEMTPGRGEVAGFAGGVHVTKGGGNHTALGGAVGAAVHKSVFVFGEFTYVPIGVEGFFELPGTVRSDASARLVDFSGGSI